MKRTKRAIYRVSLDWGKRYGQKIPGTDEKFPVRMKKSWYERHFGGARREFPGTDEILAVRSEKNPVRAGIWRYEREFTGAQREFPGTDEFLVVRGENLTVRSRI